MIRAYSIQDVRAAETLAMEGLAEDELMQRAAHGLAKICAARLRDAGLEGARVVALAGPGGNGGDALFAAAELADSGHNVLAILTARIAHPSALAAAEAAGVIISHWATDRPDEQLTIALAEADLVIDGILGIGARPGLPSALAGLPELISEDAYLVAVDLPSGQDPSGDIAADGLFADETVTFSLLKPVHLSAATEPAVGVLSVVEIGVPQPPSPVIERFTFDDVAGTWPVPGPADNKYSRGVLGLITGSDKFPGAAVLGATAAVTAGAGMVRYLGPDRATDRVLAAVPEAVPGDGRVQAWVIGSGWSPTESSAEQLDAARGALESDLPVLLDAGGLDLLEAGRKRRAPTVLTPHAGELARLANRLGVTADSESLLAQILAKQLNAVILLKGSTTMVYSAESVHSQADAPAWLATAGAGDVLAGIIGTLLAAGVEPARAAALGALVHGVAAHDANPGGPVRALEVAHAVGGTIAGLLGR
jgi:hydroxyethylthiazole kinase-like uncharacterized protein yjeF